MATSYTANHNIPKPAAGDKAWQVPILAALDLIDTLLPTSYAGDPNTHVAGIYLGQPIYDSVNDIYYKCKTIGDAATAIWTVLGSSGSNGQVPVGGVIMWSGKIADIPTNWALCNGTAGTPDLRNRFIIGADVDTSNIPTTSITGAATQTGGAASVTSGAGGAHDHGGVTGDSTAPLPSHSHSFSGTSSEDGNHSHTFPGRSGTLDGTATVVLRSSEATGSTGTITTSVSGAHTHTFSGTTGATGSGGTHNHSITAATNHTHTVSTLSPYYALAFIMRTA